MSIIMPVYNVENYIVKSVESVISQNGFKDFEFIVVNDGTKDRSIELIEELISNHENILLINQKNSGLSEARNTGLRYARGEFISFVDSDDWLEPSMLDRMYNAAVQTESEIAVCNIMKTYENDNSKNQEIKSGFQDTAVIRTKDVIDHYFEHEKIAGYAVNKIYKAELFQKNQILYPKDKLFEDISTTFELIWHSKKIVFLEGCYYNYLQRGTSITGTLNAKIWDLIENVYSIKKSLIQKGVLKEYRKKFLMLLINQLFRVHLELQKNKENENYRKLRKNLDEELGKINLITILISSDIKALSKLKISIMKLEFNRLLDFLLWIRAYKNDWRSGGQPENINKTIIDFHKEGSK